MVRTLLFYNMLEILASARGQEKETKVQKLENSK